MNTLDTSKEYQLHAEAYGGTKWNKAPAVLLMVSYDKERVEEMAKTLRSNNLLCDFVITEKQLPTQPLYPR